MSIKERWQRIVSRKSLSSGHSSSSSSSTNSSDRSAYGDTTPYSTGASTPTHPPIPDLPPTPITIPSAVTTSKPSPQSSSFQSNFLSKTLTWRSSHGGGGERKEKKRSSASKGKDANTAAAAARRRVHPSERPLTEANLRQQEMLAQFKWEFGRSTGRRNSLGGWSVNSGISPCQSRRGSYSALPPDQ